MVTDAARALDLPPPELYVHAEPGGERHDAGHRPAVDRGHHRALDLFDDEELRFVIGQEVGHVLSGHGVYRTMLFQLVAAAAAVAWMPIGTWGLRAVILPRWRSGSARPSCPATAPGCSSGRTSTPRCGCT